MPRLAANLTMLFGEVPFLDRFAAAANAGFSGVEYLFPYAYDKRLLKQRLDDHGLKQVMHNLPAGDWTAGERGISCDPSRVDEFRAGVAEAIDYATTLDCTLVNCLAGIPPPGLAHERALDTFVGNLRYAAPRLEAAGIRLTIEAVNTRDIPGFFLSGTQQALDIIAATGVDNLFLEYDVYHMQIMEGDLAPTIARHLDAIVHIQIADSPGRHEPGTGEINYPFLLDHIDQTGYAGWIGCEYVPRGTTEAGLAWAKPYLRNARSA